MKYLGRFIPIFMILVAGAGCVVGGQIRPTLDVPTDVDIARLWQEPGDVANRDLFYGPGGAELMPAGAATFAFVAADRTGYSPGFDVRDANGLEWSVKLGPEAQTEVAVSRVLWALGYHQPPTYYIPSWTMTGEQAGLQGPARFRRKLPDRKVIGEWSWYENDFINSRPFKGLVVVNVLLNNWDWKTSNNKIYEVGDEGQPVDRIYV